MDFKHVWDTLMGYAYTMPGFEQVTASLSLSFFICEMGHRKN